MSRLDEFGLIRLLTSGRGHAAREGAEDAAVGSGSDTAGDTAEGVVVGIGDDAAVLNGRNGFQWVASCDTMVQDVHFKAETMTYSAIGFKAMASNISDMAAMGAIPRFALLALSIPPDVSEGSLQELYDGLYECAGRYGVHIIGGDTTGSPVSLVITVTILGEVEAGRALLRSSCRPGDAVFVTGPLGRSAAGLHYMLDRKRSAYETEAVPNHIQPLIEAHQRPLPQVKAGRLLVQSGLGRALNDISDGLASEAWELAEASRCRIELQEAALPLAPELSAYGATAATDPMEWVLYGGEDYQLVGTVAEERLQELSEFFQREGLELRAVGKVLDAGESNMPGVTLRKKDGTVLPLGKKGYNHFQA